MATLTYKQKLMLNRKALQVIKNIKPHIEKGCLSNIPPGWGTNRNERLHRKLRKIAELFSRAFKLVNDEIEHKTGCKEPMITCTIPESFGIYNTESADSFAKDSTAGHAAIHIPSNSSYNTLP